MKVIRPFMISDVSLVSSTVLENEYAEWASGTTYALSDVRQVSTVAATVTLSIAIPCVVTQTGHGYSNGKRIKLTTTGALPTGLSANKIYFVRNETANTYQLSETKNGLSLNTTGSQSGVHTATASIHRIYEAMAGANTGHKPWDEANSAWWLDISPTNKWAMFDDGISTQTQFNGQATFVVQAVGIVDSVALLNVSGGGSVNIVSRMPSEQAAVSISNENPCVVTWAGHTWLEGDKVKISTSGALPLPLVANQTYYIRNPSGSTFNLSETAIGALIATTTAGSGVHTAKRILYDSTYSMTSPLGAPDWWAYFLEPYENRTDLADIDLPQIGGMEISVTITNTGFWNAIGALVIGQSKYLGATQMGASIGIVDYSVKQTDVFGNSVIVERAYSKRGTFSIMLDTGATDAVASYLAKIRATPSVFVGSGDFTSTVIYGFAKDFSVVIAQPNQSICSLDVEGLT